MKIDTFAHILPEKYHAALKEKIPAGFRFHEGQNRANAELNVRLQVMERYPDVAQVLTVSLPPLEVVVSPQDAVSLAKIANDEMAELLDKYPQRFVAAVACLPLNDIDAALEEIDRAIKQLKFRGIQMFTNINGEPLSLPKFRPIYKKMAAYNLPIWIHPWVGRGGGGGAGREGGGGSRAGGLWAFDVETATAMMELVSSGVFHEFPDIKFVTHHAGGIVPILEGRIGWAMPQIIKDEWTIDPLTDLRKFYGDTAVSGSTNALMCGYGFLGVDRILFATDAPLGPEYGLTLETIRSVENMPIPDNDKAKIFERNAVKLLRLRL